MANKSDTQVQRRLLEPFKGRTTEPPPIWLMRQAGRYLPEYREVRAQGRRFPRLVLFAGAGRRGDAAADPALRLRCGNSVFGYPGGAGCAGPAVRFVEGEGPRLEPIASASRTRTLEAGGDSGQVRPRFETVARLRQDLPHETALIGFCGAPWTVATYMVGGQGSTDQAAARLWAYRDRQGFQRLIDLLVETSRSTIFRGRWRPAPTCCRFSTPGRAACPTTSSTLGGGADQGGWWRRSRRRHPEVPIIGFPRGAGGAALVVCRRRRVSTGSAATRRCRPAMMSDGFGARRSVVVQGNLDPLLLVAGGRAMEAQVRARSWTDGGPALHLQSRPRHRAADAAGERGAAGRDGAGVAAG